MKLYAAWWLTWLLLTAGWACRAAEVIFDLRLLTGSSAQRDIIITPTNAPGWTIPGTNAIFLSAPITLRPVNGIGVTNLVPGAYRVTFSGLPGSMLLVVPDTNAPISARDHMVQGLPVFVYSSPGFEATWYPLPGQAITLATNEIGGFRHITFSAPAAVTNNDTRDIFLSRLHVDDMVVHNQLIAGGQGLTNIPVSGLAATGTPGADTYLRGDGVWASFPGGGSTEYIIAGPGIDVATNGTAYTISAPHAVTNNDTRQITLAGLTSGSVTADTIVGTEIHGSGSGISNIPLSALAQSGAAAGQVPMWNGNQWAPATVSGGDGSTEYIEAGPGILVATNGSLYTISTPAITNLESRLVYITNYAGTRTNFLTTSFEVPAQSAGWYRVAESAMSSGQPSMGRLAVHAIASSGRHSVGVVEVANAWNNAGHSPQLICSVSHFGSQGGAWLANRIIAPSGVTYDRAFLDLYLSNASPSQMTVRVGLLDSLFYGWRIFNGTNVPDDGFYVPYSNPVVVTQSLLRVGYGVANRLGAFWHDQSDGALWSSRISATNLAMAGSIDWSRLSFSRPDSEAPVPSGMGSMALRSFEPMMQLGWVATGTRNILLGADRRFSVVITNNAGSVTPSSALFDSALGTSQSFPLSQLPLFIQITNSSAFGIWDFLVFYIPAWRGYFADSGILNTWTLRVRDTTGQWHDIVTRTNVTDRLPITVPLRLGPAGRSINAIELLVIEATGPGWASSSLVIPEIAVGIYNGEGRQSHALGAVSLLGDTVYGGLSLWSNMVVQTGGQYIGNAAGLTNIPLTSLVATGSPSPLSVLTGAGWTTNVPGTIEVINVRDFGAKGDGVTDDWDALHNILAMTNQNIAAVGAYRLVYFPAGTYLIRSNITWPYGTRLVGDGAATDHGATSQRRGTLIRPHPNWNGTALIDTMSWHRGEWHHFATMENIGLVGTIPGQQIPVVDYGVRIHHAGELCTLRNVKIYRFVKAGVWAAGNHAALFLDGVSIHNTGWYAVQLTPGSEWDKPFGVGNTWSASGTVIIDKLSADLAGIAIIGMNGNHFVTVRDAKIEQISQNTDPANWPHVAGTNIFYLTSSAIDGAPASSGRPTIYWSGGHINHDVNNAQSDYRNANFFYSDSGMEARVLLEGARVYGGTTNYAWVRTPTQVMERKGLAGLDDAPIAYHNITNYGAVLVDAIVHGSGAGLTNIPLSALAGSGASVGQVPQWDGNAWVPANVSGGGGSSYPSLLATNRLWVSKHGNDATGQRNNPLQPFKTLEAAWAAAQSGDQIILLPGEHLQSATITADKNLHIVLDNAVWRGADEWAGTMLLQLDNSDIVITGVGSIGLFTPNSRLVGASDSIYCNGNVRIAISGDMNASVDAQGLYISATRLNAVSYSDGNEWILSGSTAVHIRADELVISHQTAPGTDGLRIFAGTGTINIGRIRCAMLLSEPLRIKSGRLMVGPTIVENVAILHDGSNMTSPHVHHVSTVVVGGGVTAVGGAILTGTIIEQ